MSFGFVSDNESKEDNLGLDDLLFHVESEKKSKKRNADDLSASLSDPLNDVSMPVQYGIL